MAALTLVPMTHVANGLMRWSLPALLLHSLWGWQFITGCLMELLLAEFTSLLTPLKPEVSPVPYYTLEIITLLLIVVILAEVCLYANESLEIRKWMYLQIAKVMFVAVWFCLLAWVLAWPPLDARSHLKMILIIAAYWFPWLGSLTCAIIIKYKAGKAVAVKDEEVQEERRPLIPTPLSPAMRAAVDRRGRAPSLTVGSPRHPRSPTGN